MARGVVGPSGLVACFREAASLHADLRVTIAAAYGDWLKVARRSIAGLAKKGDSEGVGVAIRLAVGSALADELPYWVHLARVGALAGEHHTAIEDIAQRVIRANGLDPRSEFGDAIPAALMPDTRFQSRLKGLDLLPRATTLSLEELLPVLRNHAETWIAAIACLPLSTAATELLGFVGRIDPRPMNCRHLAAISRLLTERPDLRLELATADRILNCPLPVIPRRRGDERELDCGAPYASVVSERLARSTELASRKSREARKLLRRVSISLKALRKSSSPEERVAWSAILDAVEAIDGLGCLERLELRGALAALVRARRSVWHLLPPAPRPVTSALNTDFAEVAPPWLRYLALPLPLRCTTQPPECVLPRKLTQLLTDFSIALCQRRPSLSGKIWESVGPARVGSLHSAWDRVFLDGSRGRMSPAAMLEWLANTSARSRRRFVREKARLVAKILSDHPCAESLLSTKLDDLRAQILAADPIQFVPIARSTIGGVRSRSRRNRLNRRLDKALGLPADGAPCIADVICRAYPREITTERAIRSLGGALTEDRLVLLFAACHEKRIHPRHARSLFEQSNVRNRSPLRKSMVALLRSTDAIDPSAREGVWRGAQACGHEVSLTLLSERPDWFAPNATKSIPIELLLVHAVRHPLTARHLAGGVPAERFVEALPAVRRALAHRPQLLAVAELAALSDIREVSHLRQLARTGFRRMALPAGTRFDDLYSTHEIPKKTGGMRTICVPTASLKRLQSRLLRCALDKVPLHDAAHGFRPGRSILSNAIVHTGRPVVANVDIKAFFQSTRFELVLRACRRIDAGRISYPAARLMAELCCFEGSLPTGAPTSPAIGNIVLLRADRSIATAATRNGISYTRYADDLTFSGGDNTKQLLPFVSRVLHDLGYQLDRGKTQLYRSGRRQLVTGLVVNRQANLPREVRRRLRAAVNVRASGGLPYWEGNPMSDQSLAGWVALLHMVQPAAAKTLKRRLLSAPNWMSIKSSTRRTDA